MISTVFDLRQAHRAAFSLGSAANKVAGDVSTIGRIWKAFHLKPPVADTFKLSSDPLFVEKFYDVVGLYLNPPEHAVVLCADEKSQVQALDPSRAPPTNRQKQAPKLKTAVKVLATKRGYAPSGTSPGRSGPFGAVRLI